MNMDFNYRIDGDVQYKMMYVLQKMVSRYHIILEAMTFIIMMAPVVTVQIIMIVIMIKMTFMIRKMIKK